MIPAALEYAMDESLAHKTAAGVISEGANGPITPVADEALGDDDVLVVPDILANAGGAIVSYFEWPTAAKRTAEADAAQPRGMGTPLSPRVEQTVEVVERLHEEYPDTTISLDFSTRMELLVAVILSAQCTDERVNKVTADLFEKYGSVEDFAKADQEELAEELNSVTYFNSKASYIRDAAGKIVADHDGEVPDTMSELTDLSGVGRKTANVVLQHGHDVVEGIVVDTHVQRLTRRLGITEEERPEAIEADLMSLVPESEWQEVTHLLISHGRAVCSARNPDCGECVLADVCPSEKGDSDVDLASGESWS